MEKQIPVMKTEKNSEIRQRTKDDFPKDGFNKEDDERCLSIALKAGSITLGSNSESAQCDEVIRNILTGLGKSDFSTCVISKSIFIRLGERSLFTAIENRVTNLYKICRVNEIARNLVSGKCSIGEAEQELKKVDQARIYSFLVRVLSYVCLLAGLPILLSGSLWDCFSGACCGLLLGLMNYGFRRLRIHSFASIVLQTFVMALFSGILSFLAKGKVNLEILMVVVVTPMFPGFTLTTGVRDALQGDYISGTGRLMEAIMETIGIAFGVAMGTTVLRMITNSFAQKTIVSLQPVFIENDLKYLIYIFVAFLYSASWCYLYEVPSRFIIWGAAVGCVGRLLNYLMISAGVSKPITTFAATMTITLLAHIFSQIFKAPTMTFLIAGIMSQVPGRALYNSVQYLMGENYHEGAKSFLETFAVALSIAIAVFLIDTVFLTIKRIRNKEILK